MNMWDFVSYVQKYLFQFRLAYRPGNESSYEELFASAAEMLGDGTMACGSNIFSEEFALYGSKVRVTFTPSESMSVAAWKSDTDLNYFFVLAFIPDHCC